jgi:hypothetical protein
MTSTTTVNFGAVVRVLRLPASGHVAAAPPSSVMNSRRLMHPSASSLTLVVARP